MRRLFIALFALLFLVGAGPARMATKDVLGEPVQLGSPGQQRPMIVVLVGDKDRKTSSDFLRGVDEQLLNAPIDTMTVADVRKYGSFRSIVSWKMRRAAKEARDSRKKRREDRHVDASPEYVNRWHLVADFDGALFNTFGVAPNPEHPVAFLVKPDGAVAGPYADVGAVVAAVGDKGGSKGD